VGAFLKEVPHAPKNFQKRNRCARPFNCSYLCMGKGVPLSKQQLPRAQGNPYPFRSTKVVLPVGVGASTTRDKRQPPCSHKLGRGGIYSRRNERKPPHRQAHKRVVEGALLASLRTPKTRYARFREPQPLGINPLCGFTPSPDPYRESKNSCQQQTHLGRAIYAPKMEKFCQNQNPRRSSSERRAVGRSWRERPSFLLGYFLGNAKK